MKQKNNYSQNLQILNLLISTTLITSCDNQLSMDESYEPSNSNEAYIYNMLEDSQSENAFFIDPKDDLLLDPKDLNEKIFQFDNALTDDERINATAILVINYLKNKLTNLNGKTTNGLNDMIRILENLFLNPNNSTPNTGIASKNHLTNIANKLSSLLESKYKNTENDFNKKELLDNLEEGIRRIKEIHFELAISLLLPLVFCSDKNFENLSYILEKSLTDIPRNFFPRIVNNEIDIKNSKIKKLDDIESFIISENFSEKLRRANRSDFKRTEKDHPRKKITAFTKTICQKNHFSKSTTKNNCKPKTTIEKKFTSSTKTPQKNISSTKLRRSIRIKK